MLCQVAIMLFGNSPWSPVADPNQSKDRVFFTCLFLLNKPTRC